MFKQHDDGTVTARFTLDEPGQWVVVSTMPPDADTGVGCPHCEEHTLLLRVHAEQSTPASLECADRECGAVYHVDPPQRRPYPAYSIPLNPHNPTGDGRIYRGRFYNHGSVYTAIVAVVEPRFNTWAAYIGATFGGVSVSEEDAMRVAAGSGAKLLEADARYYFPFVQERWRA